MAGFIARWLVHVNSESGGQTLQTLRFSLFQRLFCRMLARSFDDDHTDQLLIGTRSNKLIQVGGYEPLERLSDEQKLVVVVNSVADLVRSKLVEGRKILFFERSTVHVECG